MDTLSFLASWPLCGRYVRFLPLDPNLFCANEIESGGFDCSVHISEEVSNAAVAIPWAIVGGIGISGVLGWGNQPSTELRSPDVC